MLSKSSYIRFLQCPKSLFLNTYSKELKDTLSPGQEALFDSGHNVGEIAQRLYPNGINISDAVGFNPEDTVAKTKESIKDGQKVIYEAYFEFEGALCGVDILVKKSKRWYAYEVKASTEKKEPHINDIAFQYYVLINAGIDLKDFSLIHINNKYVREGDLDINQLFTTESVLEDILPLQDFVKENIAKAFVTLKNKKVPDIDIGPHCSDPYDCDFGGYCWKHIPDVSVFNVIWLKSSDKFDLYNKGIIELKDIPKSYELTEDQDIQVDCFKKKKTYIDKKEIKKFLEQIRYPLYYMDFETFNPAIPPFDNTRPYQITPFQFSLHYQSSPDSELKHVDFLAEPGIDPRLAFIKKLLSLTSTPGQIIVYNKSFEGSILRKLALVYPKYAKDINERLGRLVDLMEVFKEFCYYHPDQNGSYSIKAVLPVLVPELSYSDLEGVHDGGMASATFEAMQAENNQETLKKMRESLLEYCKLDTLAMVKILEKLAGMVE